MSCQKQSGKLLPKPLDKRCSTCRQLKPLAAFCRRKPKGGRYKDGYSGQCKDCLYAPTRLWRKTERGRIMQLACNKRRKERAPDKCKAEAYRATKRNRIKFPEAYRARWMVRNAIRDGKLTRKPCFCGAPAEAHHEDYSKPLEVDWLCTKHHKVHHHNERKMK